jgi:hypothetical protein
MGRITLVPVAIFALATVNAISLAEPVPGDWLSTVQERIAEEEYQVTWQDSTYLPDVDAAWHAPNRAHGFRSYFTGDGMRVIPRTESEPSWEWGLALVGYGRGENVWPVAKASLRPSGNRIDYDRGGIIEFYVNDPGGVEQGFKLWAPPEQQDAAAATTVTPPGGPLSARLNDGERYNVAFVEIALTGTLQPAFSTDGQAIDFRAGGGFNVVHFSKLKITDASGRELPAWMEGFARAGGRGIRIVFDDADAAYPVTIDPLATSPAWHDTSAQAGANFGVSVATAGDVNADGYSDVIVGASFYDNGHTDEGRAYVYHGSASGLDTTEDWTAESDRSSANFGYSVATAGDVNDDGYADVIIGAHDYENGQSEEGRAYVYHGSASGLAPSAAWISEIDHTGAQYGVAVATAGDVNGDGYSDVIVGSNNYSNGEAAEGGAFVYHGSVSGLGSTADWSAEANQIDTQFGNAVATAGDVNGDGYSDVVVGAYRYSNGETNEGRAFVYHGSAAGLSPSANWTAESDQGSAYFGISAGTAGDVNGDGYADVIVGAHLYDNSVNNEGGAFVYHGSASGLATSPAWSVFSEQDSAQLGFSVGPAGDVNGDGYADVIGGAPRWDEVATDEGIAAVFLGSAAGLETDPDWTSPGGQGSAQYGYSVATAGDVNGDGYADVIVGEYRYDTATDVDAGRAYVYHGSAGGLASTSIWAVESDQQSAQFGWAVSTAGDVNGDGYADVIVGAPYYDNGQDGEGRAFVYHGSSSGVSTTPTWSAEGNQTYAIYGTSVETAGDVNGDGYSDIVVGAPHYDNGQEAEGRAYVYLGSAAGVAASPSWLMEGDLDFADFGRSVATAGDVNGDGYADVIVGATEFENGEGFEGGAFVYHGSASGLSQTASWSAEGNQLGASFGFSVSTAGDVNSDGYDDVIVGAYAFDNDQQNEGKAFVYHGGATGLSLSPAWTGEGDKVGAGFGRSVDTAGDVNGDGYADVIVGAWQYDNVETNVGRAYVYHGSSSGLSSFEAWTTEGVLQSAHYGFSVSTAGDVNGDGYADVIVGDQDAFAYVYHGSAAGLPTSPNWSVLCDEIAAHGDCTVGNAGDVNGDGYADVIVGSRGYANGETSEGRAQIFCGNEGTGLSHRPEQRTGDDAGLIAKGGHTRAPDGFRLTAIGQNPFGRSLTKLEWEVKPRPSLFDGSGTGESTSWIDTGTAGVALNEAMSNLEPGDYHWRVRLLYDTAASPFAQWSRWFTVPWNGWNERDLSLSTFIGGVVWNDHDRDGVRESGEPELWGITVDLLDSSDVLVNTILTNSAGEYHFEVESSDSYRVRFVLPGGYRFTMQDQGSDDSLDSDANPVTGETALIYPPHQSFDSSGWSAGMLEEGPCFAPDEPIYIYSERKDAFDNPILDFQDPNQSTAVTGYNVYRSSDAGLPADQWPQVASDVVDMDEVEPYVQWVDESGDVSPTGVWYYEVTAYNNACGAEGPR